MARLSSAGSTIATDRVRGRAMQHQLNTVAAAGGVKNAAGAPRDDEKLSTPDSEKEKPEER